MKLPDKIVFHEDYESLDKSKKAAIKADHRDKLLYRTRLVEEETPSISPRKAKAKGLSQFLKLAGIGLICIESQVGKDMGLGIYDPTSLNEICFISNKDNLMNKFYNFYYGGIFDSYLSK
ncbi:hypothetical protein HLH17_06935 [Acinetobacter sp. ANC 5380]|uniref:Uncharacterized protein n=1 Tax=Acinetobacter terrae TaxID=2731247 RepID=A0A7Y2REV6_9GAMM|nr:hypothetical protein [Acinetobacter terrae]NNH77408.1 hypothetical protein [Acinetobacter terrae]